MVRGNRSDPQTVSAPSEPEEDRVLVARFVESRDEAAFRALYRRHAGFLYRFLLRLSGGDTSAAEEGVQETWIRAAQGLARLRMALVAEDLARRDCHSLVARNAAGRRPGNRVARGVVSGRGAGRPPRDRPGRPRAGPRRARARIPSRPPPARRRGLHARGSRRADRNRRGDLEESTVTGAKRLARASFREECMSGDDDLTPEEKRALEGLASGPEPPPALEDAVVSRLAERGLIAARGTEKRRWAAWALAAAAGVALFAAGLAVGTETERSRSAGRHCGFGSGTVRPSPLRRARRAAAHGVRNRLARLRVPRLGRRPAPSGQRHQRREALVAKPRSRRGRGRVGARAARRLLRLFRHGRRGRACDRAFLPAPEARRPGGVAPDRGDVRPRAGAGSG